MYLSKKGFVLRKEQINLEELKKLKSELMARPLTDSKFNKNVENPSFPVYIETKNKLYIPKMYGIEKFGFPDTVLENYEGIQWNNPIEFNGELYPSQIDPVDKLLQACYEKGGGILQMQTGGGKSICLLNILSKLKGKAIIVVNKIPLMNQWISEIKNFLPNAVIGTIQGQKNINVEKCDIIVTMLQSMARIDYPDSLFKDIMVTVIDECFPYNTHIITSNGNINIGTLYYMKDQGKNLPMVKTFNEITKRFEWKKIVNVFRKKNDILIDLYCSKMKISSTENHKYLTYNGWKEAKNITLNDYLISNYDKNTINSVCPALNNDQYQILLGSFLGDGHITTLKNGRYRLSMTHGKNQYDYCKWKAFMFGITNVRYIKENGYSKKEAYQFSTKSFYLFHNVPKNKTYVPQWILDDLDEKGLAIWFMDDGNISKTSFTSKINTDSFDEDSQKRIVLKLKSMNIDCKYKNYKKSYYHIIINETGTKNLIRLIAKYIHNNILYKLLPNQYISYLEDMSINIIDQNTIFCKKENIKQEFLIENKIYKIYKNFSKTNFYYIKYLFCLNCNSNTFHTEMISKKYWKCNHTYKNTLSNMPIEFNTYKWNNEFLDYGYSKITKIITNVKNFNTSKVKLNYVFDMEIEDNHNYIVRNTMHGKKINNVESGFVVHNCHNLASRSFSQVLFKLCSKYTIGLSATPIRADGCEYVFKWHIGDIVYKSDEKRIGKPPIIKLLRINTSEYKEINMINKFTGQKTIQFTSMLSELVEMSKRNLLIIELIKNTIKKDTNRKILVLSDRRNHLQELKRLLDETSISFTYGLFLGSMKQKDLAQSRASQCILATFAAFSEGVSEKDLDTLILVSPKKFIGHMKNAVKNESGRLEQTLGRVFRKDHIERNPVIIDLQDDFSVYSSQYKSRVVFYKQHFKNVIFENSNINLDEHDDVSINYIKVKKTTEKIEKKEDDIKFNKVNGILKYCIID